MLAFIESIITLIVQLFFVDQLAKENEELKQKNQRLRQEKERSLKEKEELAKGKAELIENNMTNYWNAIQIF